MSVGGASACPPEPPAKAGCTTGLTVLHVVPAFELMEVRAGSPFDPVQFIYPMMREQIEERLRNLLQGGPLLTKIDVHTGGLIYSLAYQF